MSLRLPLGDVGLVWDAVQPDKAALGHWSPKTGGWGRCNCKRYSASAPHGRRLLSLGMSISLISLDRRELDVKKFSIQTTCIRRF